MKLTETERQQVDHWRRWCTQGGRNLVYAPDAIQPLLAIIDRGSDEIEKLRAGLIEISSQAVCACIATDGECFAMLQNCAEIAERTLAIPSQTHNSEAT